MGRRSQPARCANPPGRIVPTHAPDCVKVGFEMVRAISIWVAVLCLSAALVAQVQTGSLTGVVRDNTGAVVPGATVTAKNIDTGAGRSTQSNNQGAYSLLALTPGQYEVTVASPNFRTFKQPAVVTVGGTATVDAKLSVSAASTTVEVPAEAAGAQVNTQTQEISQIITPQQIQQLPSLTRNPYDFVALSGNVSGGDRTSESGNPQMSGGGQNQTDRGVGFSINGQRSSGTEILLDGVENINLFDTSVALEVPQDAVQEYRIITNNFDAQYGRASGGVVNVNTKSGTNAFHGSAWEYNRLSAYTANTYDNNAQRQAAFADGTCVVGQSCGVGEKGTYTRNQFGFQFGGPIIKQKLFFYGSAEWTRVRSNASLFGYVPTPQLLAATAPNVQSFFNAYGANNFNYISTVTAGQLASSANGGGAFLGAFPNPNTPVLGLVNYVAPADAGGDLPQNTYTVVARLDYNLSDRTQAFVRYGRENANVLPSPTAGPYQQYNVGTFLRDDSYLGSLTHNFTNNLLSNTRLSYNRDTVASTYDSALQNTPTLFLYNGASYNNQPINLPGFFDATTGVGGLPFGGPQNTIQAYEDLAWTKGAHTIRFGGQFNYIQLNKAFGAYAQGVQQLGHDLASGLDNMVTGVLTNFQAAVNPAGALPCAQDPQTLNLIQTPGCTITLPATQPSFSRSYRYRDWAAYAQDSWRITPRLTLNYGLRYEYFGVQHGLDPNLDSNLYWGPGSNEFQQLRTGQIYTVPNSPIGELWSPRYGTVAPRGGFAWDVFGDGKTSIRGGAGISYERNFGNVTFNIIQNPPNYATVQLHNTPVTTSNFGPLGTGTGAVPLPPVSPRQVNPDINIAQTQFWSLTFERQVGRAGVFGIDYNGSHGVHLYDIANINELGGGQAWLGDPLLSDPTGACGNSYGTTGYCPTRPNAQFTSVNNRGSNGFSHYNGATVRFQSNNWGDTGLSIVTNYTWSHSLDNVSSTFSESSSSSNGIGNLGYLNPAFPSLDYGNSDFDIRQRFVFSAVWQEPFFSTGKGFLRQIAGGWIITPIFNARSGIPFTVSDSTDSLNGTTQGPYGIPRYAPSGPIGTYLANGQTPSGPNAFSLLTLPAASAYNGALGLLPGFEDFGPYPADMTPRNAFRGPGAWSFDASVAKNFKLSERFNLEFRAEAFDLLNHHNFYVNGFINDVALLGPGPLTITGKKGGLGSLANNGNHDERRFGQFALRLSF